MLRDGYSCWPKNRQIWSGSLGSNLPVAQTRMVPAKATLSSLTPQPTNISRDHRLSPPPSSPGRHAIKDNSKSLPILEAPPLSYSPPSPGALRYLHIPDPPTANNVPAIAAAETDPLGRNLLRQSGATRLC